MKCQICDKEVDSLFVCDRCGKHSCKDCVSSMGESTVCRECVGKRQNELKKEVPAHKKILSHGGVLVILAFWVLVGAAYLAIQKMPYAEVTAAEAQPPKNVEITDYRPVCNSDGLVYALELSLANAGNGELAIESIIVNDKNAEYSGDKALKPGEMRTYSISAQDIFGTGFSRSGMPRGAKILVVTDKGSANKLLTTNPAACVQK